MESGLPPDWQDPEWFSEHLVHNWRNHVPEPVQLIWQSFTGEQKQVLARHFEQLADMEEWD